MSYVKSFIRGIFRRRKAYWNDGIAAATRAAGLADGVGGAGATAGGQVGGNPVEATLAVVIEVHGIRRLAAMGKGALGNRPIRRAAALRRFTGFSTLAFSLIGVVAGSVVVAKRRWAAAQSGGGGRRRCGALPDFLHWHSPGLV